MERTRHQNHWTIKERGDSVQTLIYAVGRSYGVCVCFCLFSPKIVIVTEIEDFDRDDNLPQFTFTDFFFLHNPLPVYGNLKSNLWISVELIV